MNAVPRPLAIAMPQILKSSPLEHLTGGVQGIVLIKPDAPVGADDQRAHVRRLGAWLAANEHESQRHGAHADTR